MVDRSTMMLPALALKYRGARAQNKGRGCGPPPFIFGLTALSQPSRRVREQRVDHAGFRDEVAAQRLRAAVFARDLVEQPLELGDVAVDRLLEAAVGTIFSRHLVKGLLTGGRVEAL